MYIYAPKTMHHLVIGREGHGASLGEHERIALVQGYLAHKKHPPPQHHHMTLGVVLL